MRFSSRVLVGLLALLPSGAAFAGGAAQASLRFLNIGVGSRQTAMGGAAVGLADDVNALYYNPAGLSQLTRREAAFLHTQYAEGISFEHLAYGHPTSRHGTFAGDLTMLQYGSIKGFDENNAATGEVSASDLALSGGWGGTPFSARFPELQAGLALKIIREKLDSYSATAFALDLGLRQTLVETPRYSLTGALALRNLGTQVSFASQGYDLPRAFVAGLGFKGWSDSARAALDAEVPQFGDPKIRLGGEYWTLNTLALRLGIQSGADLGPGISGGLGIKLGSFQLDYAVVPFGALGFSHQGSVLFRFSGLAGELYEKGVSLMSEGRYAEASEVFTRLLSAEPRSRRAVLKLRECQHAMAAALEKEKRP